MNNKYPIYEITAKWNQDCQEYPTNSTGFSRMFKEVPTFEVIMEELHKWWNNNLDAPRDWSPDKKTLRQINARLTELSFKYLRDDTWCISWFWHYTFNQFNNQAEAFNDFEIFVEGKESLNRNCDLPYDYCKTNNVERYCLMGAEDRWRWKLCDCAKCKELGMTTITH